MYDPTHCFDCRFSVEATFKRRGPASKTIAVNAGGHTIELGGPDGYKVRHYASPMPVLAAAPHSYPTLKKGTTCHPPPPPYSTVSFQTMQHSIPGIGGDSGIPGGYVGPKA